jgi:hypothetical protein
VKYKTILIYRTLIGLLVLIQFSLANGETAEKNIPKSSEINTAHASLNTTEKTNFISANKIHELSRSMEWLRLLYYKKSFRGRFISEISNPKFFISSKGKSNPEIEFKNTVAVFAETENINDEHPICKFPARFYLLNKKLNLNQLAKFKNCTKMNEFIKRLNGQSVSMVFSSYFINNPSSAFGHTFLKINKSDDYELDLLNYGINYAATVDTQNSIFYALKGLLGFFPGEFTAIPYYYKVREYNDYESRDLWEYQLNLNPEDILLLNLHIWELGRAWSWYYFLDKNCSYWAIRVLEAVRPDLDLVKYFKSPFVVPIETVKSLLKIKGLVKSIKFRPSLREQLISKFKKSTSQEIKEMDGIVYKLSSDQTSELNLKSHKPDFLETTLLYFDYKNAKNYVANENSLLKKKQPLLQALSEMPTVPKQKDEVDLKNAPHFSHPPRRLALGYKTQELKNLTQRDGYSLQYKQGFHELLDSSRGFNPHMSLNYLDASLIIFNEKNLVTNNSKDNQIVLDHFHIISIDAFMPVNRLESNFSWRVRLGLDKEQYLRAWDETVGFITFDSGLSKAFLNNEDLLVYFLVSNTIEASGRFENAARLGISPLVGLKFSIDKDFNLIIENKPLWVADFSNKVKFINQSTLKAQNYFPSFNSAISIDASYLKSSNTSSFNFSINLNHFY